MEDREGAIGAWFIRLIVLSLAVFGAWSLYQRSNSSDDSNNGTLAIPVATATQTFRAPTLNAPTPKPNQCDGILDWGQANEDRAAEGDELLADIKVKEEDGTATRRTFEAFLANIYALSDDQRNSRPPPAAEELNEMIADNFELLGDATDQYFRGNRELGDEISAEIEVLFEEIDAEAAEVTEQCT